MTEVKVKGRKILVAVDESEESMYALSWCIKNFVCESFKDTLILLYAKTPRAANVYSPSMDGSGERRCCEGYLLPSDIIETMERYSREMAQCVMDKAKGACKDLNEVELETMVEHGDPRDVICVVAERLNVDFLVMGSHGYGLLRRAFLGSVSNHCAQKARCPVLIVKKPPHVNTEETTNI